MDPYIIKNEAEVPLYSVYYELAPHDSRWSLLVHYSSDYNRIMYGSQQYKGVIAIMKRAGLSIL